MTAVDPTPALPESVGRGRYRVTALLGQGGMATVYRVVDSRLGATRAVKVLSPAYTARPNVRRRFETEARAMAVLTHPNILSVLDVDEDAGMVYIVMEYLPGGSLQDLVEERGALHPAAASEAVRQALLGLQAAHDAGVVHRDVKPHNILLTSDGTAKITDFGIAHVGMEGFEDAQTRTGSIMGTWAFMAPEQRLGQGLRDPRVDLFAAAVTLYTIVAGRLPPGDLFVTEAHDALFQDISEPLRPILARAGRYKAEDRYASATEMAEALTQAIPGLGVPPPDPFGLVERRRTLTSPTTPPARPQSRVAASVPPAPASGDTPANSTRPPVSGITADPFGATFSNDAFDGASRVIESPARRTSLDEASDAELPVARPARTHRFFMSPALVGVGVVAAALGVFFARATEAPEGNSIASASPPLATPPAVAAGALTVTSPGVEGAEVWLDGTRVGNTPWTQATSTGTHTVRVVHPISGLDRSQTVEVTPSRPQMASFVLDATQMPPDTRGRGKSPAPPRVTPPAPTTRAVATPIPAEAAATPQTRTPSRSAATVGTVRASGAVLLVHAGPNVIRVPDGETATLPSGTWSYDAQFGTGNSIHPGSPIDVDSTRPRIVKCSERTETCRVLPTEQ